MAQKFDYPKSEQELRNTLDALYQTTQEAIQGNQRPSFKGLIEIMRSEVVILTAIHNIKSNKGSKTPGSDGEHMQVNILERDYEQVISRVQALFEDYRPQPVRRVWIPKPGKTELRPLGIPTIIDRIVQECTRIVLEPILESQFFAHSYGFRPMRDTQTAIERVTDTAHKTGYHWIIEGDISKFFDNVNHTILLKKLYGMGIHDRRVLMVIKAMLKAGIMDEMKTNPLGTPQGGIISPLLANAYLHTLDQWIVREWEGKETRHQYVQSQKRLEALRKRSNLKPAFLIRYADDWVLITNTRSNAEKWKYRIAKYLSTNLRLTLSEEKTLITNVREKRVRFLGYDYKQVRGKARKGWIPRLYPNEDRLKTKIAIIRENIRKIRRIPMQEGVIHQINLVNSQIRGLCNYYQNASWVNIVFAKYSDSLKNTAYRAIRKQGGKWIRANELNNLINTHARYTSNVPGVQWKGYNIGVTSLSYVRWQPKALKNQLETPYTELGRELYRARSGKTRKLARDDEMLNATLSGWINQGNRHPRYNFEYFLNRAYALNRDHGRCRVCGNEVDAPNLHIHHRRPWLPLNQVNRVGQLATMHKWCHQCIHDDKDWSSRFGTKAWKKILTFREELVET